MNRVKHKTVLNVLEQRAERFRLGKDSQQSLDERLYEEALDETGTVDTEPLSEIDGEGAYCSNARVQSMDCLHKGNLIGIRVVTWVSTKDANKPQLFIK